MKKILIITVLLIIFINAFYNCYAFEIGTTEVVALRWCEPYFYYNGNYQKSTYAAYLKDGKYYPAYCLNREYNGVGSAGRTSYDVIGDSKLDDEAVWRTIINGYPYKSLSELGVANEDEGFYATKMAIYTIKYNQSTSDYTPQDNDTCRRVYNAYLKIVEAAKNSNEILANNNEISITSEKDGWNTDDTNEAYVSKTYNVNSVASNGTYTVSIEGTLPESSIIANTENQAQSKFTLGEKFKILIPIENMTNSGNFKIKVTSELETKPIVYGRTTIDQTQNYALTGYMKEDATATYDDNYIENTSKIIIIKREFNSEKVLSGVKFNLLDENQNIIQENLVTDKDGQIILEKMMPGKYYIKEIETVEGYNLYNDLIEVNLKLNEELNIIVNNTLKTVTEIEKQTETVQVTSNYDVKKLPVTGY
jgi:hypothetical protein